MDQALMCPWCRLIKKTIAAQLLHNYTHIPPPKHPSLLAPSIFRKKTRSHFPSTFSKISDSRFHFFATILHFCKLSTSPRSWRGRWQPIFQHWTSWPLESLLKHHQCVMPTSFLGENKRYFSLFFFPPWWRETRPLFEFSFLFSGIKKKKKLKTNLSKFPPCLPSYIF